MPLSRRQLLRRGASALLLAPLTAIAQNPTAARSIGGAAFGGGWIARFDQRVDPQPIHSALKAVIASVDASMSPFRSDSEISRFNASSSTDWSTISAPLRQVAATALQIAEASSGSFDPTVGGQVARFGFGPIKKIARGNYQKIEIGADALRKAHPTLSLDLCGIAKGYALDQMAACMRAHGVADFLIELGGEVCARGLHPNSRRWQVAIESPEPGSLALHGLLTLENEALATSGDKVNGYSLNGQRYGHIIDPRSGAPASQGLASVSVIAPSAMLADAWATALYAAGPSAGAALAQRNQLSALLLQRHRGALVEISCGRFADRRIG